MLVFFFFLFFLFFFFFNDTATTEIYTLHIVGSVRCVQETGQELRAQLQSEFKKIYKQFTVQKPLFSRINEEYAQKTIMPQLEERKQKLQKLRELYKPQQDEIVEHMKKYDEFQKQMKQRIQAKTPFTDRSYEMKAYSSKAKESVFNQDKIEKLQLKQQAEDKRSRIEKVKQFKQLLKDQFQPKIDQNKVLEMKAIIDKLQNKHKTVKRIRNRKQIEEDLLANRINNSVDDKLIQEKDDNGTDKPQNISYFEELQQPSYEEVRNIGHKYLQYSKQRAKKDKEKDTNNNNDNQICNNNNNSNNSLQIKKEIELNTRQHASILYKNYLKDLRLNIKSQERRSAASMIDWEKDLNQKDLKINEKLELVLNKVHKLDNAARLKEKKIEYMNGDQFSWMEDQSQLEDYYVQSIKAKIALLKQFSPKAQQNN
eukprot:TRINITY_DN3168_c0_g1_i6.p1 TRINITY_DN3168_c0_g1~~TRINITY_DN3168_c0_g1_i6.p1  ORF type:complete len:426 (-),score=106.66 TRINITY_DN3168_c0_g1_i6:224-1501(-)